MTWPVPGMSAMPNIEVERWSFWSPESGEPAQWASYWQRNDATPVDGNPRVEQIPPMQRRRMSRLAKMALNIALEVIGDTNVDYSVFCSRHGEIVRTREILASIVSAIEISPTAFAQSVHNTSSGLFTITASSTAPSMSMAAGANTFAYGWLEAQAYLAGNPDHRVLLVDFDEIIPEEFRGYSSDVSCDHALAMLLRTATGDGVHLGRNAATDDSHLPQGPQFLAWLQSNAASLSLAAEGQGWRWER